MKSGLFITFEGTEGSGKTTQSKILYEHLKSQNIKTIWTREIGGVEIAEKIRDIILHNEMDIMTEFLLVLAARKEHITKLIKPSLEDGYVVICDRFIDSTLVYQGYNIGIDKVLSLHNETLGSFMPDSTFFIDVSPEIGLSRALARGDSNKFENYGIDYHNKIYERFMSLSHIFPDRIHVINGSKEKHIVTSDILSILKKAMYF